MKLLKILRILILVHLFLLTDLIVLGYWLDMEEPMKFLIFLDELPLWLDSIVIFLISIAFGGVGMGEFLGGIKKIFRNGNDGSAGDK